MENLQSSIINDFHLQYSLSRIVDVVNFEGPLLTLYENVINKQLYLLDWVDSDSISNRWLIYCCNPTILDKYIKAEISHKELFMSDEDFCYVVDIDKNFVWNNPKKLDKNSLPLNYIPIEDSFFEESDCPNFSKLERYVNEAKVSQKPNSSVVINHFAEIVIQNFYKIEIANLSNLNKKFNDFTFQKVEPLIPIDFLKNHNNISKNNKLTTHNFKSNYLKQYV